RRGHRRGAVQAHLQAGRIGGQGELDLVGQDVHEAGRGQPGRVGDREGDAVPDVGRGLDVGRGAERAAGDVRGGRHDRVRVLVPVVVEEVDPPGHGGGAQGSVLLVAGAAGERDGGAGAVVA